DRASALIVSCQNAHHDRVGLGDLASDHPSGSVEFGPAVPQAECPRVPSERVQHCLVAVRRRPFGQHLDWRPRGLRLLLIPGHQGYRKASELQRLDLHWPNGKGNVDFPPWPARIRPRTPEPKDGTGNWMAISKKLLTGYVPVLPPQHLERARLLRSL